MIKIHTVTALIWLYLNQVNSGNPSQIEEAVNKCLKDCKSYQFVQFQDISGVLHAVFKVS